MALPRPPVYFTHKKIQENPQKPGKKLVCPPLGWDKLTESAIKPGDEALCLQTGERSGVTVYDIDTEEGYHLLLSLNPELKDVYTVKTRKGFHLVFQYDPTINTNDNVGNDEVYGPIDTRNDGGFVYAPPTVYEWRGEVVGYEYLGGEVVPFPQCLKDTLSRDGFKRKQAGGLQQELLDGEDNYERLFTMISDGGLDVQANDGTFQSWSMVAFALSHTFPNERGYELLDLFSRRNIEAYDAEENRRRWDTMITQQPKATTYTEKSLWWMAKQNGYTTDEQESVVSVFSFNFALDNEDTEIVVRKPPSFRVDRSWDNPEQAPELPGDLQAVEKLMLATPMKQELAWEITSRFNRYLRCSTSKVNATQVFFWRDGVWHTQGEQGLYNAIFLFAFVFRRVANQRLRPRILGDRDRATLSKSDAKKLEATEASFDKTRDKYLAMMLDQTSTLFSQLVQTLAEPEFFPQLDVNPWLCNFKNCIINFQTGEIREQQPEDMCSLSTGSNYIRPGSLEDTEEFRALQDEVMAIFQQIIPGTDERRYFLELLAARFIGINRDQQLYFGIGPASNGKSLIVSLCSQVFGDYMGGVPKDVFMGKQTAGQATSELANLRGRRIVFASEPGAKDVLNESLAKQFTGDDAMSVRQLYCQSFMMTVQFCVMFMTNHLIAIPADGNGIWRRLKVLPFTSLFTDDVELAQENYRQGEVFKIDRDLKNRLPALRDATTTLLVNICLRTRGIVKPCATVERLSLTYRQSQDQIKRFIDAKIVPKAGNRIQVATLRVAAKHWVKDGFDCKMELQSIIDRLQQDPYNYRFDQARTVGEGFEIVNEFACEASPVAVLSEDERFLATFAEAHVVTLKREDYIIKSDVPKFASLNGFGQLNSKHLHKLIKTKYFPLGVFQQELRVPVTGKEKNSNRMLFIGIKRVFWRADGATPPEDVIAGDLNSSMASDTSDVSVEEDA